MDREPDAYNPHNERWVETYRSDDGSYMIHRYDPDATVDDTEYSELLHQIEYRIKELGIPQPSFVERLRAAERELAPLHDEGIEFLEKHGLPGYLTQTDREWVENEDWKKERW